jgi:hypothetical protein
MGHNGPPENEPTTPEEKVIVLKAVSDMRLALASGANSSVLDAVWSGVSSITAKLGGWALTQVGTFFNNFTPAAGQALGEKWPYILGGGSDLLPWLTHHGPDRDVAAAQVTKDPHLAVYT